MALEEQGELTSAQARTVLKVLVAEGGDPAAIAAGLGFQAMASGALEEAVDEVIAANPREWERYRGATTNWRAFSSARSKRRRVGTLTSGRRLTSSAAAGARAS